MSSSQPTTTDSTTEEYTSEATTTVKLTTTTMKDTGGGMAPGTMAGIIIGAIVGACLIAVISMVMLIRYRAKKRKNSSKYEQTKKKLKIDKLPSPSEIESAEIRPLDRKPTKNPEPDKTDINKIEIETDFSSSVNPYQNVPSTKYENVDQKVTQPIYMEPKPEDKRIYNTAEGSEYYTVDNGRTPNLPNRDDEKQQKQNVNKNKKGGQNPVKGKTTQTQPKVKPSQTCSRKSETSDSSDSESDSSIRDYINLQDQNIVPPEHIAKGQTQNFIQDEVYENEEVKYPTPSKTKR